MLFCHHSFQTALGDHGKDVGPSTGQAFGESDPVVGAERFLQKPATFEPGAVPQVFPVEVEKVEDVKHRPLASSQVVNLSKLLDP